MPRGVTFDELLQQQLSPAPIDSRPAGTHNPAGMGAAYGFFFVEGSCSSGSLPAAGASLSGRPPRRFAPQAQPPVDERGWTAPRPMPDAFSAGAGEKSEGSHWLNDRARELSAREKWALQELQALGASLSSAFTFPELRSAFRGLARRYHPDRHAGCGGAEKSRLAAAFGRARDAYRVLAERFRRLN
jgi:hypothetical protein